MEAYLAMSLLYGLATLLTTLVHELGHAAVPLAVTTQPVTVQLGPATSRPLFRVSLGRVTLDVRRLFFVGGFCFWPGLPVRQHFWAVAGGPLASLLMLTLGAAILLRFRADTIWTVTQVFMIVSFAQLMVTLWPMRYPAWYAGYEGFESDGARLLRLWPQLRARRI